MKFPPRGGKRPSVSLTPSRSKGSEWSGCSSGCAPPDECRLMSNRPRRGAMGPICESTPGLRVQALYLLRSTRFLTRSPPDWAIRSSRRQSCVLASRNASGLLVTPWIRRGYAYCSGPPSRWPRFIDPAGSSGSGSRCILRRRAGWPRNSSWQGTKGLCGPTGPPSPQPTTTALVLINYRISVRTSYCGKQLNFAIWSYGEVRLATKAGATKNFVAAIRQLLAVKRICSKFEWFRSRFDLVRRRIDEKQGSSKQSQARVLDCEPAGCAGLS
jgi:hypothetical protein